MSAPENGDPGPERIAVLVLGILIQPAEGAHRHHRVLVGGLPPLSFSILLGSVFHEQKTSPSPEEILRALKRAGEHQGVGGKFHYSETSTSGPHYEFPIQLKFIREGSIVSTAE